MFTKLFRTKSFFIALILTIFFSSKAQAFTLNRSYGNDRYQTAVAISNVIIIGGPGVVSDAIISSITALSYGAFYRYSFNFKDTK